MLSKHTGQLKNQLRANLRIDGGLSREKMVSVKDEERVRARTQKDFKVFGRI